MFVGRSCENPPALSFRPRPKAARRNLPTKVRCLPFAARCLDCACAPLDMTT